MRLRRVMLPDLRRQWTRDIEASLAASAKTIADLQREVERLRVAQTELLVAECDRRDAAFVAESAARLSQDRLAPSIADAIARAPISADPMAHVIVDGMLPRDFYDLLVRAIPPQDLFSRRDPLKQDFEMADLPHATELARRVWGFFDDAIVGGVIGPALMARFREQVIEHYARSGGRAFGERAAALPHRTFTGRIQLRRPGYALQPHLDPRRVVITGLLYFPRSGDSEAYGTDLFRVDRPFAASGTKTFFPEQAGLTCERVATVPYRPNTMLAFVNSGGAHGATLPADAPLQERYAFQFYVKPDDGSLRRLLDESPADVRAAWDGI